MFAITGIESYDNAKLFAIRANDYIEVLDGIHFTLVDTKGLKFIITELTSFTSIEIDDFEVIKELDDSKQLFRGIVNYLIFPLEALRLFSKYINIGNTFCTGLHDLCWKVKLISHIEIEDKHNIVIVYDDSYYSESLKKFYDGLENEIWEDIVAYKLLKVE